MDTGDEAAPLFRWHRAPGRPCAGSRSGERSRAAQAGSGAVSAASAGYGDAGRADYAPACRSRSAALLRSSTDARRRSQLFQLPSTRTPRNGRAAQVDRCQARPHPRHAPTILNAGLNFIIHWRGDRDSLEDQVIKALASPITNGQPDEKAVIDRLEQIPSYAPLFKAAFPDDPHPMTGENIAKAIGAYERTLVTPSPFDHYLAGDVNALSPKARGGLDTFINTGCVACHNGVLVGGGMYRKFGVVEPYWNATGSQPIDNGRADVTKNPDDLYVFRVASLRNVAMTAPYFHDGSVATLPAEAVRVMARVQLGVTLGGAETSD